MKKRLSILFVLLICMLSGAQAQLTKTIELTEAGTLEAALGDDIANVTELIVKGPLNDNDFYTMREKMKTLQILDMSGVTELPNTKFWDGKQWVKLQLLPTGAFINKLSLKKVIFPTVVEIIFSISFQGCSNLIEVDFSLAKDLKYIYPEAFKGCNNLKSLDFSKCTNLLELGGFRNCSRLEYINLSNCTKLKEINDFENCISLKNIDLSNLSALENIGAYAFSKTGLESINIKGCSSLTNIGEEAFADIPNLSTFDFESLTSLEVIKEKAFYNTGLTGKFKFGSSLNQIDANAFNNTKITSLDFSNCKYLVGISDNAFSDCTNLEEIIIDNSGYTAQDGVLYSADMTTLFFYPQGKKAESYIIPSSVIAIKNVINSQLKKIIIPISVQSIEYNAFGTKPSKLILYIQSKNPIDLSYSIGHIESVHVPFGTGEAYRNADIWKEYTIIEDGLKLTITNTTPDYGNVLQSGSGEYEKGTKVQVKALPYAGYKFVGWYQNSKLLSEETTYELTLTAQETTIEARFAIDDKQEEVHTLVIGTEGSHAGGQVSVQGLAKVGEQITVTAIPDAGYAFEGWYLDGKLIETALKSSTFKVEKSMTQLVAKFKALPFQLETDGGEEDWTEVLLYRDSEVYMTAKKVSGYTFLGWYLGDKLLSTSYDYTFDVSQLRASLPTLKAKYFHGIVANESISSEKAIQIYRKDARLVIQSAVPIAQVEIYSFAGTLLHSEGGFEQEAQINAPSGSFILRLKTADDEYIVRKVR